MKTDRFIKHLQLLLLVSLSAGYSTAEHTSGHDSSSRNTVRPLAVESSHIKTYAEEVENCIQMANNNVEVFRRCMEKLRNTKLDQAVAPKQQGWLWLILNTAEPELLKSLSIPSGVLVGKALSDGPIQKAGIKAGEVISSVDGNTVVDKNDVSRLIAGKHEGDKVILEVVDPKTKQRRIVAVVLAGPPPSNTSAGTSISSSNQESLIERCTRLAGDSRADFTSCLEGKTFTTVEERNRRRGITSNTSAGTSISSSNQESLIERCTRLAGDSRADFTSCLEGKTFTTVEERNRKRGITSEGK